MGKLPSDGSDSESSCSSHENAPKPEFKEPTTWPEMIKAWPKTTFCIVSNEFCERFSYYGMRTVLTFYLLNVLKFSDSQSTIFFNGFTVLCYFTPILGSIIADGFVGKFWTIFTVSLVYASGQIILAIASTKDSSSHVHPWLDLIGLITIGFGTGGIKPCVSAFGGDQFEKGHERMLSMFFSMFYFSINAGSMISTFIAPIFRSMSCMGQDSCYPLAFGVPAILMIVATCLFMGGSFWYKKKPPTENVFGEVFRIIFRALGNKMRASESKEHWLDHYMTTHDCERDPRCQLLKAEKKNKNACHKLGYVDDVRQLLRLLVMFLPVPMFWALYDQQGSVWLIQGIQMDCRLWGNVLFMPDQVQVLNAVLILCFIPIFQVVIYPVASKFITLTPLRKMVAGGMLAACSFMITGFVQLRVNQTLALLPSSGQAFVSFANFYPGCEFDVLYEDRKQHLAFNESMQDTRKKEADPRPSFHVSEGDVNFTFVNAIGCPTLPPNVICTVESKKVYFAAVTQLGVVCGEADTDKPEQGTGEFSAGLLMALNTEYGRKENDSMVLCRAGKSGEDKGCDPRSPADFYYWENNYNQGKNDSMGMLQYKRKEGFLENITNTTNITYSDYAAQYKMKPVKPGRWWLYKMNTRAKNAGDKTPTKEQLLLNLTKLDASIYIRAQGGVYLFAITSKMINSTDDELYLDRDSNLYMPSMQIVQDNSVSILWQVPQIVVLTAAEILFSITGYEFAYSQCAPTMKSVVQAAWLFTTAIGDSIIVGITAWSPFENMATMFFVYAIAMAVVIGVFALMAIFYYDYKFYTAVDKEETPPQEEQEDFPEKGRVNGGFSRLPPEDKYSDFLEADIRF